ncbi:MAG TPA: glucose-6-phosphate dehydrogenase, partial [Acidimicrobiales bacterium]
MEQPHVIVLFGATGDLSRRKLLPGLLRLWEAGLITDARIVGTSLEDMDTETFVKVARAACDEFGQRAVVTDEIWDEFATMLSYVPQSAGPAALADEVRRCEESLGRPDGGVDFLHYLSVPPKAALDVVRQLDEAGLVDRSRIIMEKPFGTDLASAKRLNGRLHEVFDESQIFRIDHFLGKEAAQNILAFRFANGLFEPIWNRNFIDHVQIDVPETLGLEGPDPVLRDD